MNQQTLPLTEQQTTANNTVAGTKRTIRNRLTHDQYFKLCEWCKANVKLIEETNNMAEVSRIYSEATGVVVTGPHIKQACDTAGLVINAPADLSTRVKTLEAQVQTLEGQVQTLEGKLQRVIDYLNNDLETVSLTELTGPRSNSILEEIDFDDDEEEDFDEDEDDEDDEDEDDDCYNVSIQWHNNHAVIGAGGINTVEFQEVLGVIASKLIRINKFSTFCFKPAPHQTVGPSCLWVNLTGRREYDVLLAWATSSELEYDGQPIVFKY